MKEIRPSKIDDQEKIQKAYELILELVELNSHIESSLWAAATILAFVNCYIINGFTHQEFKEGMYQIIEHYKPWFEEE